VELEYIKTNVNYPEINEVRDTYILTLLRKANIQREQALEEALGTIINENS